MKCNFVFYLLPIKLEGNGIESPYFQVDFVVRLQIVKNYLSKSATESIILIIIKYYVKTSYNKNKNYKTNQR